MHGRGKFTYADGHVYEGEWRDNERNGQGKITYADGHVYEGDFKDNMRHYTGKKMKNSPGRGQTFDGDTNL